MFLLHTTTLVVLFCMYSGLDGLDSNMLVFWGYPTSSTKYCVVRIEATSFDDCVSLCLASEYCMVAYGDAADCTLCDIYTIDTVSQTDSTGGVKVAIKVDVQDTCPAELQDSQYTRTNDYNSYSISYAEPIWTITYEKNCVDMENWRMFPRPVGAFCLTVGAIYGSDISQVNSTLKCNALGTGIEIGGMQTEEEYDFVMTTARTLLFSNSTRDYTTIWISGTLKSKCASTSIPADCNGIDNFPYQDNFDAYTFGSGYPSFTPIGTTTLRYQDCLWLNLGQKKMTLNGQISNAVCSLNCNGGTTQCGAGYVCGGLAQ